MTDIRKDPTYLLLRDGENLSNGGAKELVAKVAEEPNKVELRIKLFGFFSRRRYSSKEAMDPLVEQALWLIENVVDLPVVLAHAITSIGYSCTTKQFTVLRSALLDQVRKHQSNASIIGRAGQFIIWHDYERAEELLNRAHELDSNNFRWWATLSQFAFFEFTSGFLLYKEEYAKKVLSYGPKAIEFGATPDILHCSYVAKAGIFLKQFEVAEWAANLLGQSSDGPSRQISNALLGQIALGKKDIKSALYYLSRFEKGYVNINVTWELARELCLQDQGKAVIDCIEKYRRKVPVRQRNEWIELIRQGKTPTFEGVPGLY